MIRLRNKTAPFGAVFRFFGFFYRAKRTLTIPPFVPPFTQRGLVWRATYFSFYLSFFTYHHISKGNISFPLGYIINAVYIIRLAYIILFCHSSPTYRDGLIGESKFVVKTFRLSKQNVHYHHQAKAEK